MSVTWFVVVEKCEMSISEIWSQIRVNNIEGKLVNRSLYETRDWAKVTYQILIRVGLHIFSDGKINKNGKLLIMLRTIYHTLSNILFLKQ